MGIVKKIKQVLNPLINPSSLGFRLTIGIATVSALGLGSVAAWISIRMQHILIVTHKQTIEYIAERFPRDVEIYSDMVALPVGVQKAIDNLTDEQTLLWVETSEGKMIAQSENLDPNLLSLKNVPPIPQVEPLQQNYWLMCATPLEVNGVNRGTVYIAQNITGDQIMFLNLIGNLAIATLIAIIIMTVAIAVYIRQSLKPLKKISQLTANISADDLKDAHISLENAPAEVQELAQTFDEMLIRLSMAWEHQQQLLSNVSHELRTPLTIVSGYIQSLLRRGNNLTPPQKEALEIASSEANRTIQLMQDLLDLARVDSGRMRFQLESLVVNELIAEIGEMAKQYSNREIFIEAKEEAIAIKADLNRLKQVLLNLIDNAVKYSPENQPIKVTIEEQNQQAKIEIIDYGVGIPLSQQSRIFERFYRVDETRCRSTGGTGLGLSIVKTLVEGMGGTISVYSQPDKGSTFTVCFPILKKRLLSPTPV